MVCSVVNYGFYNSIILVKYIVMTVVCTVQLRQDLTFNRYV